MWRPCSYIDSCQGYFRTGGQLLVGTLSYVSEFIKLHFRSLFSRQALCLYVSHSVCGCMCVKECCMKRTHLLRNATVWVWRHQSRRRQMLKECNLHYYRRDKLASHPELNIDGLELRPYVIHLEIFWYIAGKFCILLLCLLPLLLAQQPNAGQGLIILEVSRSHNHTHTHTHTHTVGLL
jgi:hypothetical protein